MPTTLRDLFTLPDAVTMTAFVHQIDGGDDEARKRQALELYQVTPSIERKLDAALAKLRDGLRDRKSVFTWIHGSFGSGKSHFMNVLSLLLADDGLVYETHAGMQKQRAAYHPEVIGRKLFRLHVQCISRQAASLEDIVFGPATEELARRFPGRPAPPLFAAAKVFSSAKELLASIGDEKFFAAFPSNQAQDDEEWGQLASRWDRARFEKAVEAPSSAEGRALAGELARTPWLKDVVSQTEWVRLGEGLQILTEYLKQAGYEGVVLFLDELILWLTTLQEDKQHLAIETPKIATLIEHGTQALALPIFTFAARQRDLSQMVGHFAVGKDEEIFRDSLKFWKDRFDEISLEDKDLARIIEARILKPRNDAAKTEIDRSFEGFRAKYAKDFNQLFGDQGDPEDFRRVYPFSPALVESMVSLSSTLQRDRTALRELTNLLVNYLPDFELGRVVPVGDLFDVIVHGRVSDLATIQQIYEQARRVYENELLPHIRKKTGTDKENRCQLQRDSFDTRLGCSGCAEKACRTQTRIAKTVLLQGIAPNAPALRDLTASRIVALNSGTLKSVVPNQEVSLAAGYLREWAAICSAVQVQGDANPTVRAALDSVDTRKILDHNRSFDNVQRRRLRVRDVLFEKLGVRSDKAGPRLELTWCERTWNVGVVYENVRNATDPTFRPGEGEHLRLIVDFPFDESGKSPTDDEDRLREVLERGPQNTVVWLPTFLNEDVQNTLGDLVILDGLVELKDDDFANRVPWVSADDLARAREIMRTQRGLKQTQVENALASAYGVTTHYEDLLDQHRRPDKHVHLLVQDAPLSLPSEGDLQRCLEGLLKQALQRLAPRHPPFLEPPTKARLEKVTESLVSIVQSEGGKRRFDAGALKDLRGIAAVEHFGLVRIVEDEAIYAGGLLTEVQRRLATRSSAPLSVADVRAAIDPDRLMWLTRELEDLLIIVFASASHPPYRFAEHGAPVSPVIGKLKDEAALVSVKLPTIAEWEKALTSAGVLGISLGGRALSASQMEELAARVTTQAQALEKAGLEDLHEAIGAWGALLSVDSERTQRGEVVRTLLAFLRGIPGKSAYELALHVGAAFPQERQPALLRMANADRVKAMRDLLTKENHRDLVENGRHLETSGNVEAREVLDVLRRAFRADENVEPFATALDSATTRLIKLMRPVVTPPQAAQLPAVPVPMPGPVPVAVITPVGPPVVIAPRGTAAGPPSVIATPGPVRITRPADLQKLHADLTALVNAGTEFEVVIHVLAPGTRK